MTAVCIHTDPACLAHDPGPEHPEQVGRLQVVLDALRDRCAVPLEWRPAPQASQEQLLLAHTPGHVAALLAACPAEGLHRLDPDTLMSPGSYTAALHAAGAVCAAVDGVMGGDCQRAFCAVRPPGHHALADQAMGFCLFANIAIGALHARHRHGLERVAVVDFDVHHGNGTEAILAGVEGMLYISTHQHPLYPGTGATTPEGVDNILDLPLEAGCDGRRLLAVMETAVVPALDAFRPQLLLISAGFDAHRDDPLAGLALTAADFGRITRSLVAVAGRHCRGRVVSALEGGYCLEALADSVLEHVTALA